jgi:hypothetical protein
MKKKLSDHAILTAKRLRNFLLPQLANLSIRTIRTIGLKELKLPSYKISDKPLLAKRIKKTGQS